MAAASLTTEPAELMRSATTTIDSLPVEILTEVLLRVPTPAALVHAAAASRSWRGAIANPEFLARYRKRHRASPFLGLYIPREFAGPPTFQIPDSIRSGATRDGDFKHAARKASDYDDIHRYQDRRLIDAVDSNAFTLGPLEVHPDCRLLDCHNSRLLLTRGDEALEVRSPLSRESILLPFPPDVHPDSLEASLLGHDDAAVSFRVVYLQHRREGRNRQVRAVEYDSTRNSWQDHSWQTTKNIEGPPGEVMHAGHRMFCRYKSPMSAALMLDTRKMEFSVLPLPCYSNYIIGESEENACSLVESVGCANHRLRVWQLDEEKLDWELKKDIKMDQVLGEHVGYYRPRAVSIGIALVCSTTSHHHFVVDLNTCRMKEKFEFHGWSAYPMQMPWPPAFSGPTANVIGSHQPERKKSLIRLEQGARCHRKYCVKDPEIPDDVQIATSCCREASATSTAAVSAGECKLLLGNSGSTFKFTDVGIIDVSITSAPSLSDPSTGESAEQKGEVARDCAGGNLGRDVCLYWDGGSMPSNEPRDLDIEDSTATAPTSATAEQCFGEDKNYVQNDYLIPDPCDQFSDLMNPKGSHHPERTAGGFDMDGGPASVGDARTGSGESDAIEGIFCGTLAMAPPAVLAAEPEEPLLRVWRSWSRFRVWSLNHDLLLQPPGLFSGTLATAPPAAPSVEPEEPLFRVWRIQSRFCLQRLNHDLLLQPPALASCPQQGGKLGSSRGDKGSPEATGRGRRQKMPNPKYIGGDWV